MNEREFHDELLRALGEALQGMVVALAAALRGSVKDLGEARSAYAAAELQHPKWVHMAERSKKKRIRKKYHDKIMRAWRGMP